MGNNKKITIAQDGALRNKPSSSIKISKTIAGCKRPIPAESKNPLSKPKPSK